MKLTTLLLGCSSALLAAACGNHGDDKEWTKAELDELEAKWGFESEWERDEAFGGSRDDLGFTGIGSFAHLKHVKCLTTPSELYDIAIIGAPFDTAVSYRPGARFGPRAIRQASSRQTSFRGFNPRASINPYANWATILDCGDIPVTPMDNVVAVEQMSAAFKELGQRRPVSSSLSRPKLITLGGDHSLALPALRALREAYGAPLRVLHFDGEFLCVSFSVGFSGCSEGSGRKLGKGGGGERLGSQMLEKGIAELTHIANHAAHLDTWHPAKYPSYWTATQFNHGSMFWMAGNEGLLSNASSQPSVHAGLRTRLSGTDFADHEDDTAQNWVRIAADDIDEIGTAGIVKSIMETLGTEDPVYLSIDIDVLDPAFAPGTGTPEPGGWTTRELIRILRGIEGLNLVGADVVEVSPAYQNAGEETALAAAQVVYEVLSSMVKKGLEGMGKEGKAAAAAVVDEKDEL
ncbi:arginase family-domain-containing protein [Colletotrichum godetiae]|uniref:Arginase family-domain-containing protein n=1 Tax=Colletotrichum godetiae TaxID=1209918 RepID=A0AAJ0B053_9PEZI|nr:arginase family-domain-containing protein [Colletotrichum godetiae]KAK1691324.1 arginase family-domain-containing protein [Colletotrichum godetiae]